MKPAIMPYGVLSQASRLKGWRRCGGHGAVRGTRRQERVCTGAGAAGCQLPARAGRGALPGTATVRAASTPIQSAASLVRALTRPNQHDPPRSTPSLPPAAPAAGWAAPGSAGRAAGGARNAGHGTRHASAVAAAEGWRACCNCKPPRSYTSYISCEPSRPTSPLRSPPAHRWPWPQPCPCAQRPRPAGRWGTAGAAAQCSTCGCRPARRRS